MTKKNRIEIHFTDQELEQIERKAKKKNRTRKNYCESVVIEDSNK